VTHPHPRTGPETRPPGRDIPGQNAGVGGVSRRRLIGLLATGAAALAVRPWPLQVPTASAQAPPIDEALIEPTLEAFADTLIPGEKRHPDDRAIAGVVSGPGAVQAGAVDLLRFPGAGVGPALPAVAAGLSARAVGFALEHGIPLDPTVAPWVSLDFDQRTELAVHLLDGSDPDVALWEAIGALAFLAYHTAGHLNTAEAVRSGHPGLAAIGFPAPDPDGLWRFPQHSYRRELARPHPATTATGHPA
jgi:enediyne biosynthesis protein E8